MLPIPSWFTHIIYSCNLNNVLRVRSIVIPMLQLRKLRHRKVKLLAKVAHSVVTEPRSEARQMALYPLSLDFFPVLPTTPVR